MGWGSGMLVGSLVLAGSLAGQALGQSTDGDIAGSAFIGEGPTPESIARDQAQFEAAEEYVDCLRSAEASTWFGRTDFTPCDRARDAYAAYLAEEIADDAVGCLEEGAVGAPRSADRPCARLRERFPDLEKDAAAGGAP